MLLFFYIVKEMVFPFLLSIGVITSIMVMNQIFEFLPFLHATGVEFIVIYKVILYSLPAIFMIAIPVSLIIGVYAGISRISSDYELIVMRTSGISLFSLLKPVLFVSVIFAAVVMLQAFYLGPMGITKLEELKYSMAKKQTTVNLSVKKINNFFNQSLIYIFDKKEDLLEGVFIADWNSPESGGVIEAKHGKIKMDDEKHRTVFHLQDGKIHYSFKNRGYRIIKFDELEYNLILPGVDRSNLPQRFKRNDAPGSNKIDEELMVNELWDLIQKTKPNTRVHNGYLDEFHGRIVTILSCICFAIFALPVGIYNPRNPKAGNIVYLISVLIIYFLIFAQTRSLLIQGKVPPIALYVSLLFVVLNGLVKYFKINQNIDSFSEYLRIRKMVN